LLLLLEESLTRNRQRRVEVDLAPGGGADRGEQFLGRRALGKHIARPRLEHPEKVLLVLVNGQSDDRGRGAAALDLPSRADARAVGQADVEQNTSGADSSTAA